MHTGDSVTICDELLYPVFRNAGHPAQSAGIRLLCSETSARHTLFVSFPDIKDDPLGESYLDALNLQILQNFAETVFSNRKDGGWEVCLQM